MEATINDVVGAIRMFRSREEIEAAGFTPGWKADAPAPVVGDLAVVFSRGNWRQGVVTKVTPSKVHIEYATRGGLDEAFRLKAQYAEAKVNEQAVRTQAERNYRFYQRVLIEGGSSWAMEDARHLLDRFPTEEAYVVSDLQRREREVMAYHEKGRLPVEDLVTVTKIAGDRTGKAASNLYVLPSR